MGKSLDKLSIEQLAALNEEITMLARAGVPIESGLKAFAKSGKNASNQVAERLAQRLDSGDSLAESIRGEGGGFPDLYATLVEAGVRSGRLPIALEAISDFAQDFTALRRGLFQAMVYPLLTAIAAYGLFVTVVAHVINRFTAYHNLIGAQAGWALQTMQWLASSLPLWFWIPPAIFVVGAIAWIAGGRANMFVVRGPGRLMLLLPGVARVVRCFRHSLFARLASALLENGVPLHDALPLAAGGCGKGLQTAAMAFAKADEQGDRTKVSDSDAASMRPLLRWMLRRQQAGPQLITQLRTAARSYHQKGQVTLRWIRFSAPLAFMLFVGGGLVTVYALSLFIPISEMMKQMSETAI